MYNNPLEGRQLMHNRVISDAARVSPSTNPSEIAEDLKRKRNKELLAGAAQLAAGETLGLNTQQTLELISRETRKQKRADATVTELDVMRQMAQAKNSLAEVGSAELAGIALREEPEVNPFGQDQDDIQSYSRDEAIMYGLVPESQMDSPELERRSDAMDRPTSVQAGVREALARLQAAKAARALAWIRGAD